MVKGTYLPKGNDMDVSFWLWCSRELSGFLEREVVRLWMIIRSGEG